MKKIKGTIDRFEGERAVVITSAGEVIFPKSELNGFKEGDIIYFLTIKANEETKIAKELNEELLREILKED